MGLTVERRWFIWGFFSGLVSSGGFWKKKYRPRAQKFVAVPKPNSSVSTRRVMWSLKILLIFHTIRRHYIYCIIRIILAGILRVVALTILRTKRDVQRRVLLYNIIKLSHYIICRRCFCCCCARSKTRDPLKYYYIPATTHDVPTLPITRKYNTYLRFGFVGTAMSRRRRRYLVCLRKRTFRISGNVATTHVAHMTCVHNKCQSYNAINILRRPRRRRRRWLYGYVAATYNIIMNQRWSSSAIFRTMVSRCIATRGEEKTLH